jgi:HrpA-like RNA helicase
MHTVLFIRIYNINFCTKWKFLSTLNYDRYNLQRGSSIIDNQWIAKANVKQRSGRAGRVQPGESYHLYSNERFDEMEQFPTAEILQIPLEKVIMDIKVFSINFLIQFDVLIVLILFRRRMMKI